MHRLFLVLGLLLALAASIEATLACSAPLGQLDLADDLASSLAGSLSGIPGSR